VFLKKIILFIENYIPGGNDQIALDLINNLNYEKLYLFINKRHDLRVIKANPIPIKVQIVFYSLVTVSEINAFAKSYKNKSSLVYFLLGVIALLLRYPLIIFSIFYFFFNFKKVDFNIFISNNGGYPGGEANRSASIAASLIKNVKNFHIVHNLAIKPPWYFKVFEIIYDRLLDSRTQFICVSNQTREYLIKNRFLKQSLIVVPNGVKIPILNGINTYKSSVFKILMVANLDNRKNHLLALKALAILKEQGVHGIELYILGKESEDGYLKKLKEFITFHDLKELVKFEGFVNPENYYKTCHIFLLTSILESFALVRVEAMSFGMPVITTDVGDAKEQVLDSKNGYIIYDEESLAQKILFYKNNISLIQEHGEMSRKIFMEKFTLQIMINEYIKIFEK
jgi:glycosyltransferase involved in cell wall biosynthesis